MKIPSKSHRINKKFITAGIVAVLLLTTAAVYVYAFNGDILGWNNHSKDKDSSGGNPATDEQKDTGDEIKKNNLETSKPNTESENSTQNGSSTNGNGKKTVDLIITASAQNGSTYQVRTLVGTVTSTGTCTLTLTRGAASVVKTAGLQATANSSTCRGFDVPVSELYPGEWQLNISFENDQLTGSASKTIEIK
jgi:hypothetical protein